MKFIIEHLSKRFEQKEVLKDIDFTFEEGRIYGLLGRNGAGKTTPLQLPEPGHQGRQRQLLHRRKRRAAGGGGGGHRVCPLHAHGAGVPSPAGSSSSSLWTSILTPSGIPKPLDEYFAEMSIAPEDRDKLLKDYSHGMKNKMQMLVNIIAQPNILLLDEPLTSLDVVVAEEMKNLLRSQKDGRITIFSTHILDLALL